MHPALILALDGYRRFSRLLLRLRGQTPAGRAEERVASGKAWEEFCDTLKAAGAAIQGFDAPRDPLTQAEGYRYLSRLARGGLEAFVEYADPRAPVLRRMVHETVKMGADNPDNHYQNATISGEHEYRLVGRRGTVHFLSFSTHRGGYGTSGGLQPAGYLDSTAMELGPDGEIEIHLGGERRPGNWLPVTPDTTMLMVRQTFLDRAGERPAELRLERLGGDGKPTPLTAEELDRGLGMAGALVAGASLLFARWAKGFREHANRLPLFDPATSTAAGGDPEIAYYHSYWQLADDEALLVEVTPPECEHWNFQLNNHWMESLDYRYFNIHINKHGARLEPDGSVRIVVAHRDPGLPNWVDTVGHRQGTMLLRWIRGKTWPQPQTRVVRHADLARLAGGGR